MENISSIYASENPVINSLHKEADSVQRYMDQTANLNDPTSLTYRLRDLDVYLSRMSDIMIRAKTIKEKAKSAYVSENEDKLSKLTATISNRLIDAHMQEYNALYNRLDTMYHTLEHLTRDLVTQISYIKQLMITGC